MKTQLTSSHISGFTAQLVRALHRYPEVLNFFQASLIRNCINYIHNCKDHSSCEITGQAYPPRFHSWIYYSKVEFLGSCRFQIRLTPAFLHAWWAVNLHIRQLWNFSWLSFPEFDVNVRESSRKIFTAHYVCRNADLNLIKLQERLTTGIPHSCYECVT